MKRLFALFLAAVIVLAGTGSYSQADVVPEVAIWLEGEKIVFPDAQPIHTGTRVLVPVRGFFEKIGVTVDWNAANRMVILKDGSREIMMKADSRAVLNNGAVEYLDSSVIVRGGRAFIPIRYISESFGYKVEWDGKTKSVYVTRAPEDTQGKTDDASALPTLGDLESFYYLLKYNGYMADYLDIYDYSPGIRVEPELSESAASETWTTTPDQAADAPDGADYSGTNVQVEGVDEGDVVKTDGKYIYLADGSELKIINADPQDLRIISRIPYRGSISEIYIHQDRLIIISGNSRIECRARDSREQALLDNLLGRIGINSTNVKVYDVSDRARPVLVSHKDYEGRYLSSRLTDDDLYIVTNSRVRFFDSYFTDKVSEILATNDKNRFIKLMGEDTAQAKSLLQLAGDRDGAELFDDLRNLVEEYITPRSVDNKTGKTRVISLKDVYCFRDMVRPNYMITVGIDLDSGREEVKAYLGSSGSMYVSQDHLYAAVAAYEYNVLKSRLEGYPYYDYLTTVYRFGLDDGRIAYEAKGKVPGEILNQFSMDEYKGIFRIATSSRETFGSTTNNVYALDKDMKITGKLEGIAEGERIFSTRFAGERIYMVTFREMDPFFVIDAADPQKLKVLGYLKIPGFSTYMHILDRDHVLGFGYETEERAGWGFDTTGFKVSLFDVSDVANPVEAKKEVIGKKAESPLSTDHKALMISPEKGIMGFPVNYITSDSDYFAGYHLYSISRGDFKLKGRVTHVPDGTPMNGIREEDLIYRGLYIGNNLYTVSDGQLQVHDLATLDKKGSLSLK